jgi:hypothetical protein
MTICAASDALADLGLQALHRGTVPNHATDISVLVAADVIEIQDYNIFLVAINTGVVSEIIGH